MIVTAALCWWNEEPAVLDACVRSLANIADRIVALDGAFRRYPGGTAASDPAQAEAIRTAAEAVGLECLVITPDRLWAGACEKRTAAVTMAGIGADWIVVVDADYIIHADRAPVRDELARTNADTICVGFETPIDETRPLAQTASTTWHEAQVTGIMQIPHIYHALPGIRVESHHWTLSAEKRGVRSWLWNSGHPPAYPVLASATMTAPYRVEHRCLFRTADQVAANRAYYGDREMIVRLTGQEDDVPGLPAPAFDFDTVPF